MEIFSTFPGWRKGLAQGHPESKDKEGRRVQDSQVQLKALRGAADSLLPGRDHQVRPGQRPRTGPNQAGDPPHSFLGWHLPLGRPLGDEGAKRARAPSQEAVRTMGHFSEQGWGLSGPARNCQEL